ANPDEKENGKTYKDFLNPNALEVLDGCKLEPCLRDVGPGYFCLFERLGYFCVDEKDSRPGAPVFNRTVTLRDAWAKLQNKK
ncbi:MAG: glutamine--tRNA ligase, partial [Desulfosarcina sp.]